jgi:hypothetical protein
VTKLEELLAVIDDVETFVGAIRKLLEAAVNVVEHQGHVAAAAKRLLLERLR